MRTTELPSCDCEWVVQCAIQRTMPRTLICHRRNRLTDVVPTSIVGGDRYTVYKRSSARFYPFICPYSIMWPLRILYTLERTAYKKEPLEKQLNALTMSPGWRCIVWRQWRRWRYFCECRTHARVTCDYELYVQLVGNINHLQLLIV